MATKQPGNSSGVMNSIFDSFIATSKSKDIEALNKSINNLSKILERRVGKAKKSSESTEDKEDKQRTLVGDLKDFGKGFITPFTDAKKYVLGGKNAMPENMELKTADGEDKSENKVLTLSQFKNELLKMKNTELEKNLLAEVVVIRKIVAQKAGYGDNKSTVPALSGSGLEPNTEEDKQRDRELLAQAIADKLKNIGLGNQDSGSGLGGIISSILEALGLSKLLGKTPKVPPVPGGGKVPTVPGGGKVPTGGKVPGKLGLGGRLLGPASLAVGAYEASEFLGETGYGDKMAAGAGKTAEKAFRENVAPTIDPTKMGMTPEEARNALGGSNRDIEKLGGREALLKIANTDFESSSSSKDLKEQLRIKEQSLNNLDPSLESNKQYRDKLQTDIDTLNKRIPTADMPDQMAAETARLNRYANIETKQSSATADKVGPNQEQSLDSNLASSFSNEALKQLQAATTGDQKIDILKRLENENMDLKEAKESISQILAPMITNRTVDNSTQQFVTSPPRPYPNSNGVDRWQDKRY
jgi:hypothetical protein